jgi:hypothetical protein
MSGAQMREAERLAEDYGNIRHDCPAMLFIGDKLPDLFAERITIDLNRLPVEVITGRENRRALIISGNDLYGRRADIVGIIRMAIKKEPFIMWQFVLAPASEEPLDLLDTMIACIDEFPRHFLDNLTVADDGCRVARRIFVLLDRNRRYDRNWVSAVADLLAASFY